MKLWAIVATSISGCHAICNVTAVQEGNNHGGRNYVHFTSESAEDCQQRCCADAKCGAFTWTSYQPESSAVCSRGESCCWLKFAKSGAFSPKDNCTSGEIRQYSSLMSPRLTKVSTVAYDPSGNLRDPSAMIRDPKTGNWHFWVVWSGGAHGGWAGYLHHYTANSIEGPWTNLGRAMNKSSDPDAYDHKGMFSPSALYDEQADLWYLFYSGIGNNFSQGDAISAQLVASAPAPEGPWTRLGLVTWPTGTADLGFNLTWNARRTDSGRAMMLGGRRGYWTKGCRNYQNASGGHTCSEGAYFPDEPSSWGPPYTEWRNNPIFDADGSDGYRDNEGYENCEFFSGPPEENEGERLLHVLCQGHHSPQPHFVSDGAGLHWRFVELLHTNPAKEPTPVYHGAVPGDEPTVTHFLARQEGDDDCSSPTMRYCVGLYRLDWVPQGGQLMASIVA